MLGRLSTTSLPSTAKTIGSEASRRCETVNRSSATTWLNCVSGRKKSHGHTEKRYFVLYCWNLSLTFVRPEPIFCGFIAVCLRRLVNHTGHLLLLWRHYCMCCRHWFVSTLSNTVTDRNYFMGLVQNKSCHNYHTFPYF